MVTTGELPSFGQHLIGAREVYSGQESPLSEVTVPHLFSGRQQRVCKRNILFCKSICKGGADGFDNKE